MRTTPACFCVVLSCVSERSEVTSASAAAAAGRLVPSGADLVSQFLLTNVLMRLRDELVRIVLRLGTDLDV